MNAPEMTFPSDSPVWVSGLIERHGRALARFAVQRGGRGVEGFVGVEGCFLSFLRLPQARALAEQPDDAWRMLSLMLGSAQRSFRDDASAAVREADWPFLYVRLLLLSPSSGVGEELGLTDEQRRALLRLGDPSQGASLTPSPLPVWDEARLDQHLSESDQPLLVHLVASWCKPCQEISPHLEALAVEQKGRLVVASVDVEQSPSVPGRFRARALPTLLLFSGNTLLDRLIGATSAQGIKAWLDQALQARSSP